MAQKKKKKKKKVSSGAQRSSYAKGKPVEPETTAKGGKAAAKPGVKAAPTGKAEKTKAAARDEAEAQMPGQWNVVRRGSLEMMVFLMLLAVIAVGALLQYPLAIQDATTSYNKLKKEYPAALKKWQEKYKTPAEQKKHEKDKPLEPKKPTFGDFLLYQALFIVLQGALFAFIGLNVQRRTDLQTPVMDKAAEGTATLADLRDLVTWSIPFALIALVPPVVSTVIGKSLGFIKASDFKKTPAWKYSLSYINIAISNEILFTFLVLSALVYFFLKYHERLHVEPHWAAISAATVLHFGYIYWISSAAGEKPATALIGAAFLALSLVTVLGYLYWRKGLEYSLLAGVIGFGLYPFIARLIIR